MYDCGKDRLYLLGRKFTIYSEHKAIINILYKPRSVVPLRIERLTLRLQGYDFKLAHIKVELNISDYPSRHPQIENNALSSVLEDNVNFTISYAGPNTIILADIKTETLNDKTMQMLTYSVKTGKWYELDKVSTKYHKEVDVTELKKFRIIKESLTLNIITRNGKIVWIHGPNGRSTPLC